jgi:UDP-N-acetylglucosamine transferase subunit ALG13
MIFLTVGTYPLPFNRLIRSVDELAAQGRLWDSVFAQIGYSTYVPRFMKSVQMLDKIDFDEEIRESSAIIGHAGLGSIMTALEYHKPMLVVPRLASFGEVVNDHQLDTARRFAALGHVLAALAEEDIECKLAELVSFRPKSRIATPGQVADGIGAYLWKLVR